MSGLSREQNYEIKYLRKVLMEVDDNIELPESLRGDVLRRKLDNVKAPQPPVTMGKLLKPKRWFTWQSGLTYAAAFVLIVGLFYGLGFNKSDPSNSPLVAEPNLQTQEPVDPTPSAVVPIEPTPDEVSEPVVVAPTTPDDGGEVSRPIGGLASERIGSLNNHTYYWRKNDPNDPYKEGTPVSVEAFSIEETLVAQADLPINTVKYSALVGDNDTLALVGDAADGGVSVYVFDVSDSKELRQAVTAQQAGIYYDAIRQDDVVYVLSYVDDGQGLPYQTEQLPGSSSSACVITAINLNSGEIAQKAFRGVSSDITLLQSVHIKYDDGTVALISLDGLSIEVASVS